LGGGGRRGKAKGDEDGRQNARDHGRHLFEDRTVNGWPAQRKRGLCRRGFEGVGLGARTQEAALPSIRQRPVQNVPRFGDIILGLYRLGKKSRTRRPQAAKKRRR
jgi:hypothetical protein